MDRFDLSVLGFGLLMIAGSTIGCAKPAPPPPDKTKLFEIAALQESEQLPERLPVAPLETLWYESREYSILDIRPGSTKEELEACKEASDIFKQAYDPKWLAFYNSRVVVLRDIQTKKVRTVVLMYK